MGIPFNIGKILRFEPFETAAQLVKPLRILANFIQGETTYAILEI